MRHNPITAFHPQFAWLDQSFIGYATVFGIAFVVSLALTPLMRRLAMRNRIVDKPDQNRKKHDQPVAYLGGVAIFLGWLTAVSFSYFVPLSVEGGTESLVAQEYISFPLSVIFGASLITLIGLIDDVYGVIPRVKIGGQFLAAAALSWSGQNLGTTLVSDTMANMGLVIPVSVAYLLGTILIAALVVGGCNAMNLLDGLDGLATGVASIAALGFLVLSLTVSSQSPYPPMDTIRVVMCLAMLGALLGFLPHNFNPAKIFMGDAGSHLLGYLCMTTVLLLADPRAGHGPMLVLAGLVIFGLPITDATLAVVRRFLRGLPIFRPDREHLHHQVLQWVENRGFKGGRGVKIAVLMIYVLAAVFAILGNLMLYAPPWQVLAAILIMVGLIAVRMCRSPRSSTDHVPAVPFEADTKTINPEPR